MPTYNEVESLPRLVPQLIEAFQGATRARIEIIVVDDNSPDGTGAAADQLAAEHGETIRVLHRPEKAGLATAVVAGWELARAPVLAVMDADGQHLASLPVELVRAVEQGADLAVASRYAPGGGTVNWNPLRLLVSRAGTLFTRLVLPGVVADLRDPLSGCFALRRSVIAGKQLRPLGYKILLEVLARGEVRSVAEVPYTFTGRHSGRSKAGVKELVAFSVHLLRLAWATRHFERLARFAAVGAAGVVVNLGVLAALREFTPLALSVCGGIAVAAAALNNFLLNEFWTFADWSRFDPGARARLRRFTRFLAICSGGGLADLAILLLLAHLLGVHYLLAGASGIVVGALWNYGMNANLTWRAPRLAA